MLRGTYINRLFFPRNYFSCDNKILFVKVITITFSVNFMDTDKTFFGKTFTEKVTGITLIYCFYSFYTITARSPFLFGEKHKVGDLSKGLR